MSLLEKFERMDKASIATLVDEKRDEDLYFEFKTVNSSDLSNSDDRKNLAKALSGFANSAGGLIIWGVRTGKKNKGCASEVVEIEDLSTFKMRLEELSSSWVSPYVDGVIHKTIPMSGENKGCAVTLVPASDSGPHMWNEDHRYYKRNGSKFLPMEHYEVADMFGRRKRPKLKFYTSFADLGPIKFGQEEYVDFQIIIGVENVGKGIAKYPSLSIKIHEPYVLSSGGLDGNGHDGLRELPRGKFSDPKRWGAGAETVIHPSGILEVTKIRPPITHPRKHVGKDLVIEYEIRAEDAETVSGTEIVRYTEMEETIRAEHD